MRDLIERQVASEVLSAQPEPCEDAICRKDCLKALSNLMDTDGFRDGWAVSRSNVECMLKSMPSVTPKEQRWMGKRREQIMDKYMSMEVVLDLLEAIRFQLWLCDIPSPTVPEYIEHHEDITKLIKFVDDLKFAIILKK